MDLNLTTFPQVKPKRTFELIVDLLKDRILSGEFSPGDRLPAERALAETLGVGRPSVREAYRALELMGIVDIRKGVEGGAFIIAPSHQSASETIADLLRMQHVELNTLAEARLFIEKGTAELAAKRATSADIREMTDILKKVTDLVAKGEPVADLGIEFHLKIASAGSNPLLFMSLGSIMELMRRVLRHRKPSAETSRFELSEHQKLLAAIAARDADMAVQLMDQHLRRSMRRLQEHCTQKEAVGA